MSVRTAERIMSLLMLALSVAIMLKSSELNITWIRERGPGSGAWPFWLAALMAVASLVAMVRAFTGRTPEARSTEPYIDKDTVLLVAITAGALLAMIALIRVVGMYLSFMLFLLFYLKVVGRHDWTSTLSFVLAVPVGIYLLFEVALTKYLPKGWPVFEDAFLAIDDIRYQIQFSEHATLITLGLAAWAGLSIAIGVWASARGRNGLVATLVSLAITPLGGALVYGWLGRAAPAETQPG